jgi:hypothetical protein
MEPIVGFDAVMKVHEDLAAHFRKKVRNLCVLDVGTLAASFEGRFAAISG